MEASVEGLGGITSNEVTPRFGVVESSAFSKEDGDLDF